MPKNGVHFVAVWVADEAHNISELDRRLWTLPAWCSPRQRRSQAVVRIWCTIRWRHRDGAAHSTVGDADLYVWHPRNFFWPDRKSISRAPIRMS
jgi:hypothetical protein